MKIRLVCFVVGYTFLSTFLASMFVFCQSVILNLIKKQQFLNMLPAEFDRQTYLSVAQKLNIPPKTAEKQIARFAKTGLINHFAQNQYRKTS